MPGDARFSRVGNNVCIRRDQSFRITYFGRIGRNRFRLLRGDPCFRIVHRNVRSLLPGNVLGVPGPKGERHVIEPLVADLVETGTATPDVKPHAKVFFRTVPSYLGEALNIPIATLVGADQQVDHTETVGPCPYRFLVFQVAGKVDYTETNTDIRIGQR